MRAGFKNRWAVRVAFVIMLFTALLLHRFKGSGELSEPGVALIPDKDVDRMEVVMPDEMRGQKFERVPVAVEELGALPPDTSFGKRSFVGTNGFHVFVNVVVMGRDRTSIHKPQYCLTGQGWTITEVGFDEIRIAEQGYNLPIKVLNLSRVVTTEWGEETISGFYAYWFFEEHKISTSDLGRVSSIAATLIKEGRLERWAYAGCLTASRVSEEERAYEELKDFIAEMVPKFQKAKGNPGS